MDAEKFNLSQRMRAIKKWGRIHSKEREYIEKHRGETRHLRAMLLGYLCGDGSVGIRSENKEYRVHGDIRFYPDSYSMVKSFRDAFMRVYGKKPAVRNAGAYYRVTANTLVCARDLLSECEFASLKWNVPEWVVNNDEYSKEWLRAFFDCEAYVGDDRIHLQCVNKAGLLQAKGMLERFGIECREYEYTRKNKNWNINYHLGIFKKESRYNFLKRIGLNHKKKLKKLEQQFADVA